MASVQAYYSPLQVHASAKARVAQRQPAQGARRRSRYGADDTGCISGTRAADALEASLAFAVREPPSVAWHCSILGEAPFKTMTPGQTGRATSQQSSEACEAAKSCELGAIDENLDAVLESQGDLALFGVYVGVIKFTGYFLVVLRLSLKASS